jgi:arsenate reductase (thioredoxin)
VSRLYQTLFVCIGNSCRSQMAEAFARAYGSDVMIPASAGLSPALNVAGNTARAMAEKGIDLKDHFPKSLRALRRMHFDVVINISGHPLPEDLHATVEDWDVPDPVGLSYEEHCDVRDEIENHVMELIARMRRSLSQIPAGS